MPKLAPHQIGDVADKPCAVNGCKHGRRDSGLTGYELPFCLDHLTALPAKLYRDLEQLAVVSPFDMRGVAEAWRTLDYAKRALTRKKRKAARRG